MQYRGRKAESVIAGLYSYLARGLAFGYCGCALVAIRFDETGIFKQIENDFIDLIIDSSSCSTFIECLIVPGYLQYYHRSLSPPKCNHLRILRHSISSNPLSLQAPLHLYPSRLIEAHWSTEPSPFHNLQDLRLRSIVEAGSLVASQVGVEIEV